MSDEEKKEIIQAMEDQDEKLLEKLIMELMKDEEGDDPMAVEVVAPDKEGLEEGLEEAGEVLEGEEIIRKGKEKIIDEDIRDGVEGEEMMDDEALLKMLKANPDLMKQLMG